MAIFRSISWVTDSLGIGNVVLLSSWLSLSSVKLSSRHGMISMSAGVVLMVGGGGGDAAMLQCWW
jgi:hypothetical protein